MLDWLIGNGSERGGNSSNRDSGVGGYRLKRIEAKLDLVLNHLGLALKHDYFDVVLLSHGHNKIGTVKLVKELTQSSLAKSKSIVESTPATIAEGLQEEDALLILSEFESVGAIVELQPAD